MGNSTSDLSDPHTEKEDCPAASKVRESELQSVVNKLRKFPDYKDKAIGYLRKEAEHLATIEGVHNFFSHLVEECILDIQEKLEDSLDNDYTEQELKHSKQRARDRHSQASQLKVKIKLHVSKILLPLPKALKSLAWDSESFKFGAMHFSIVVEDVLLEWGRESLVIPRINEGYVTEETKLVAEVDTKGNKLAATAEVNQSQLDENPDDTFSIIFNTTVEKSKLIRKVEEVIVTYNRKYFYDAFRKNCQHFVLDIKKALELENARFANAEAEEFMKKLEATRGNVPERLVIHADLDRIVENQLLDQLEEKDLHFLLCQYDLVHNNNHDQCKSKDCLYLQVLHYYNQKKSE